MQGVKRREITHLLSLMFFLALLGAAAFVYASLGDAIDAVPAATTPAPIGDSTAVLKLYYPNRLTGTVDCEEVYPVERLVETGKMPESLLEELLKGPTEDEMRQGFLSPFAKGSALREAELLNGIAYVDFNAAFNKVAGSCLVGAIRASVTTTLRQFGGIEGVVISVDGDVGTALQP
jgi:spore germination protein GerM